MDQGRIVEDETTGQTPLDPLELPSLVERQGGCQGVAAPSSTRSAAQQALGLALPLMEPPMRDATVVGSMRP
jgi:hypothetical protein